MTYESLKKDFVKVVNSLSYKYDRGHVFNDFVMLSACSIANCMTKDAKREDAYLSIAKNYTKEDLDKFARLLAITTEALTLRFGDFLGESFHELEIHNKNAGQFFTPYSVSRTMAEISLTESVVKGAIQNKGYISVNDPACGAGSTLIAAVETLKEMGVNFQTQSLVVGQDIDTRCACMCFIQLSLLGVPAIVYIGNTLTVEVWDTLYTPFYWLNQWRFGEKKEADPITDITPEPEPEQPKVQEIKADVKIESNGQFCLF